MMQLELFGRAKPNASDKLIDWDYVSGMDLASDERLLRRFIREQLPREQGQMQRWALAIRARRRAAWRAERGR